MNLLLLVQNYTWVDLEQMIVKVRIEQIARILVGEEVIASFQPAFWEIGRIEIV